MTFVRLKEYLDALPDQVTGTPGYVTHLGKMYREFMVKALSRPGDVAVVEGMVATSMKELLDQYLEPRKGRIYWRYRLECEVREAPVVMEYRADGPDTDLITGEQCVMDKDWRRVSCYARLYRAKHKSAADV